MSRGLTPLGFSQNYDAIVVRSDTKVDAEVIQAGSRLKAIGRAGAGVDNIDVNAATARDVVVLKYVTNSLV